MKRRDAIRSVVLISAGAMVLYSCKEKTATTSLKNIPITGAEEETVSELAEFILPKTPDFPGAKDLKTGEFVLMMSDDLLDPDTQKKFSAGMKAFADAGFVKMSPDEKKAYIDKLDGDAKEFFRLVKQSTIRNFTSSEKYLKDVKNITTLIPSKFQACIPVNA